MVPYLHTHFLALASQESQCQRTRHTQAHDGPSRDDDLLVCQTGARVPNQVPDPVETVKGERKRHERLQADLDQDRQRRETRRQTRGFQVPAEQGCGQVRGAEDVDGPGQARACDAVETGEVPGNLRSVDG